MNITYTEHQPKKLRFLFQDLREMKYWLKFELMSTKLLTTVTLSG